MIKVQIPPLNMGELLAICSQSLAPLVGQSLQRIFIDERRVGLGFYAHRRPPAPEGHDTLTQRNSSAAESNNWLLLSLGPRTPWLAVWSAASDNSDNKKFGLHLRSPKVTPMNLFLEAHFQGQALVSASVKEELGRVVVLEFANGELVVQLLPNAPNFGAITSGKDSKSVWLRRPHPLSKSGFQRDIHETVRPLVTLQTLGVERFFSGDKPSAETKNRTTANTNNEVYLQEREANLVAERMAGLTKALGMAEADLIRKQENLYKKVGMEIVARQSLDVDIGRDLDNVLDKTRTLSWNIQNCFYKSSLQEAKLAGARERILHLQQQIQALKLDPTLVRSKPAALPKLQSRGLRVLHLRDNLRAVFGASGQDNLRLLRQARAFDLWVHLKDQAGAHCIVQREKNLQPSDKEWAQVLDRLVELSFSVAQRPLRGDRLEVWVTECRYVQPIKGDRLGRVTHRGGSPRSHRYKPPLNEK